MIFASALVAPQAVAGVNLGQTYYVDCANGSDAAAGTTEATAWKSLAKASAKVYQPGDQIKFRRGTRCDGTFAPQGSGLPVLPITATAYGTGAKPQIAGDGALAAILLHNVQYWAITQLDVSDEGATPPTDLQARFGIYVLLEDYGIGHGYLVSGVDVHDVNGCDCQDPHQVVPSGGVFFKAAGTSVPTGFDNIVVAGNTLRHVDRGGIGTSSDWEYRPEFPRGRGTVFVPITGLRIENNTLTDIGGDGIGTFNTNNALVDHNVVASFGTRTTRNVPIGITSYNSNGTVIRENEVAGGVGTPALPPQAFILDSSNINTTMEYNLTHNNNAGALSVCNHTGETSRGNIYRYNISQNDDSQGNYGPFGYPAIFTIICADPGQVSVYGNTVYTTVAAHLVTNFTPGGVAFTDNIFYGKAGGSTIEDPNSTFDHNLYYQVTTPPAGDKAAVVGNPLLVNPGSATNLRNATGYALGAGSPALGAGATVPANGGRDYFGNPIPVLHPSIGAYASASPYCD